jgi:glycosyltransferase involved in cell wall biosynthesis/GT2 family glycosyltransferase
VICTYRRPQQLARLLARLDELEYAGQPRPDLHVIVIENSPDGEAAAVVDTARANVGYPLRLVMLGAGNISAARNRGLDEVPAGTNLAAWLDDDEMPGVHWLDALLTAHARTGADFVIGPVYGDVPVTAPKWLRGVPLYDALPDLPDLTPLHEGITGNALVDMRTVRRLGLRFDESLGRAGGEDQLFFRTALAAGATLRFASGATVHEEVPSSRLRLRYLLRSEYRKGNTLGILDRGHGSPLPAGTVLPRRPARRLAAAGWWGASGAGYAAAAVLRGRQGEAVRAVLRVARAAGMLTGLAGRRFDHYAPAPSAATSTRRAVIVVREDPNFQEAGHTRYLRSWITHLESRGFEVILALTGTRSSRIARRANAFPRLIAPGTLRFGAWDVVADPRQVGQTLAWRLLRRLPQRQQALLQGLRDRWRAGRGVDHQLGAPLDETAAAWLLARLDELAPDVLVFDSIFNVVADGVVADGVAGGRPLPASVRACYVITHDVVWQRAEAFRKRGYRVTPAGFTCADEAKLLGGVATPVAITDGDATTFRAMLPGREVLVVPASATPAGAQTATARAAIAGRLLFVGSASLHNVDGIAWFLERVWPQISATHPSATLHVAGSVCGRLPGSRPGVTLRGELPGLDREYAEAAIVVVPMLAGSGMKVKTVEALAYGRPVLSTSIGVQGLESLSPSPFVVADDPGELAREAALLLDDPQRLAALSAAARQAAERLGPQQAFRAFDDHLERALRS